MELFTKKEHEWLLCKNNWTLRLLIFFTDQSTLDVDLREQWKNPPTAIPSSNVAPSVHTHTSPSSSSSSVSVEENPKGGGDGKTTATDKGTDSKPRRFEKLVRVQTGELTLDQFQRLRSTADEGGEGSSVEIQLSESPTTTTKRKSVRLLQAAAEHLRRRTRTASRDRSLSSVLRQKSIGELLAGENIEGLANMNRSDFKMIMKVATEPEVYPM